MHGNETDNQVTGSNQSQSPLKKHFRISPAIQRSPVLVFRVQTQREVWFKVAFYLFFFLSVSLHSEVLVRLTSSCIYFGKMGNDFNNSLDKTKNKRKLFLYAERRSRKTFFSICHIWMCFSYISFHILF